MLLYKVMEIGICMHFDFYGLTQCQLTDSFSSLRARSRALKPKLAAFKG